MNSHTLGEECFYFLNKVNQSFIFLSLKINKRPEIAQLIHYNF